MMNFEQIVDALENKKIPCVVSQDDNSNVTIEFGFNWPEDLMYSVRSILDTATFDTVSLCGSEYGRTRIKEVTISNGKQDYFGYNKW
jgi:hypothetical protein